MYCCLAELECSEASLSECEVDRLRETVREQLNPTDKFTAIHRRMLLLTSLETYPEAKDKFSRIRESFEKKHGPSIKLNCGFAEIKDDDLLGAIDVSKQMLARTTEDHPTSGMYYYKFPEI